MSDVSYTTIHITYPSNVNQAKINDFNSNDDSECEWNWNPLTLLIK